MKSLDFTYQCESLTNCHPIEVVLSRGKYILELWGAQGGNISHGEQGGHGGYAKGIINVKQRTKYYLCIGSKGFQGTSGFTGSPYNGGGSGTHYNQLTTAASGGGGTDIRKSLGLSSRIIVAGGGSGAASFDKVMYNNGACGGGAVGLNGNSSYYSNYEYKRGFGGKQDAGGSSIQQSGIIGFGGNQTNAGSIGSGGGGGYYGGGAGYAYGATGGGGSGFIGDDIQSSVLLSGCEQIPDFYQKGNRIGHVGHGAIRITIAYEFTQTKTKFLSLIFVSVFFILK